jgi:hypothetical protein
MNGKIKLSPEPLEARSNQFTDSLRAHTKKLSAIASKLRKTLKDPTAQSELLSGLTACIAQFADFEKAAKELETEWESASTVAFLELESQIRGMCQRHNWRLDGQWPEFVIEFGVQVRIDDKKRLISVGDKNHVPLGTLEQILSDTIRTLVPKSFNAKSFMAQLVMSYDRLAAGKSGQVALLDLYKELVIQSQSARFWHDATSPLFTPFTIDQFRAQFSRMLEGNVVSTIDGRELRLFPPVNPKDAVFLYQPSERRFGFVGRLEFTSP